MHRLATLVVVALFAAACATDGTAASTTTTTTDMVSQCAGRLVAFDQTTTWERFAVSADYAAERHATLAIIADACADVSDLLLATALRERLAPADANRVLDAYRGGNGSTDANPIGGAANPLCRAFETLSVDQLDSRTAALLLADLSVLAATADGAEELDVDNVLVAASAFIEALAAYDYDPAAFRAASTQDTIDKVTEHAAEIRRFRAESLLAYAAAGECINVGDPAFLAPCISPVIEEVPDVTAPTEAAAIEAEVERRTPGARVRTRSSTDGVTDVAVLSRGGATLGTFRVSAVGDAFTVTNRWHC